MEGLDIGSSSLLSPHVIVGENTFWMCLTCLSSHFMIIYIFKNAGIIYRFIIFIIPSCHYLKNKFWMCLDIYIFPFHDNIFKKAKWFDMANHIYQPMITLMILSSFKKLFNLIHTMFKCLKFEFLFNHIFQELKY
jgi:hypothetical protein